MKFLKYIFLALIGIILILLVSTFFLSPEFDMNRSIIINKNVEHVFPKVNELKRWTDWSPWHQIDTAMIVKYSNSSSGLGAVMDWESKHENVGIGSLKISKFEDNKYLETQLTFAGQQWGTGYFIFNDKNSATEVIWGMKADLGFFGRWLGLGLEDMIAADYEKGLKQLKVLCESEKE